jgi:hypothetical protein
VFALLGCWLSRTMGVAWCAAGSAVSALQHLGRQFSCTLLLGRVPCCIVVSGDRVGIACACCWCVPCVYCCPVHQSS